MSMSAEYVQVLDACRVSLVKDLDPEDVMDYLIADGVFVPDDQERVQSKASRKEKVRQLLEIIPRRGNKAFEVFVKALEDKDSGHHHLYELLKRKEAEVRQSGVRIPHEEQQPQALVNQEVDVPSMEPITCTEPNPSDAVDAQLAHSLPNQSQKTGFDYPEQMRNEPKSPNKILDERLLSTLSSRLGPEWEQLAVNLGLSASDIYRCKMESQFNMWGQCFGALTLWRNREYRRATIQKLVTELKKCNVGRDRYEYLMNA